MEKKEILRAKGRREVGKKSGQDMATLCPQCRGSSVPTVQGQPVPRDKELKAEMP